MSKSKIVLAQRDIRVLQTEIGTRGRLAQLERWNVRFIRLSAPTADQFVDGGFQLATHGRPTSKPAIEAPVVLAVGAASNAPVRARRLTSDADEASLPPRRQSRRQRHDARRKLCDAGRAPTQPKPAVATPARREACAKAGQPPLRRNRSKSATADPLAPLPTASASAKGRRSGNRRPAAKAQGHRAPHDERARRPLSSHGPSGSVWSDSGARCWRSCTSG